METATTRIDLLAAGWQYLYSTILYSRGWGVRRRRQMWDQMTKKKDIKRKWDGMKNISMKRQTKWVERARGWKCDKVIKSMEAWDEETFKKKKSRGGVLEKSKRRARRRDKDMQSGRQTERRRDYRGRWADETGEREQSLRAPIHLEFH